MTAPYILTRSAAADLREVVRYTVANWGKAQCQAYIAELEQAAAELALGKGLYKKRDDLLPGLRVRRAGHHYLFCLPVKDAPALISTLESTTSRSTLIGQDFLGQAQLGRPGSH